MDHASDFCLTALDCRLGVHQTELWALDCIAEQELRAQQIQEDLGLEADVGQPVSLDQFDTWANEESQDEPSANQTASLPQALFRRLCADTEKNHTVDLVLTERSNRGAVAGTSESPEPSPLSSGHSATELSLSLPIVRKQRKLTWKSYKPSPYKRLPPPATEQSLPPGAYFNANGSTVHCGLPGCRQKCRSAADLRRHRESLAHRPGKEHACPGCPLRFTREDALKRHVSHRNAARCRNPAMTALRDEFLLSEAGREVLERERDGKQDRREIIAMYDAFLEAMEVGPESLSKKKKKALPK
ncbi:hypothetical protein R3P38DRAFT_3263538 [Favolaschia claudopus]|uniref:C2H2-type domain-containing protein n=1 Tax=Favolaschia claudopus TaxID=2862362 RepID=A0AAW0CB51_9AGAR